MGVPGPRETVCQAEEPRLMRKDDGGCEGAELIVSGPLCPLNTP